ncbi:MAG: glycosyltransferase family 32 protein [Pyrinomonadaceae bacterium]
MPSFHDPSRIAEDDALRSSHIRELVQEAGAVEKSSIRADIPKVIVQFWHEPNEIPEDVQACLDSWELLKNQGFKRVLFDDNEARRFISKRLGDPYVAAFDLCHHPAMRCDYFRLCYILTQGGFYVDADEIYQGTECDRFFWDNRLKIQPLCYDTATGTMIKTDVFVRARRYSPDWIFYVNNNPIIAPACHPLIRLALERATRILLSCSEVRPEIQSTTGPGNFTASLVRHSIASKLAGKTRDFLILPNWETTSISPWALSYRNDERNWRISNSPGLEEG